MKRQMIDIFIVMFLSCLAISPGVAQVANVVKEQSALAADIVQLFENLANIKLTLEPIPKEILLNQVDENTRNEFYEKRRLEGQKRQAQLDKAIGELAALGDVVIDPIMNRIRREKDIKKRTLLGNRAVDVLMKIGTAKAHKVLTDMVLGRNGFKGLRSSHALEIFLRMIKNSPDVQSKLDARELLHLSDNRDFVGRVLNALPGVPIDPELWEQLKSFVQSNDYYIRFGAARVMGAAPTAAFAKEKVAAIVKSLQTVKQLPGAHERFQYDRLGTFADNLYEELIRALIKMKEADEPLQEVMDKLTGKPRSCLIIARANRGDVSVKGELRDILTQPALVERTTMRLYAVRALERIGTDDDLPLLRQLAETDPVELLSHPSGGGVIEMIGGKPINNSGKRAVIRYEFDKSWSRARRWYPVRSVAQKTIQWIEKKQQERSTITGRGILAMGLVAAVGIAIAGLILLLTKKASSRGKSRAT